jgi:hypothetical protein
MKGRRDEQMPAEPELVAEFTVRFQEILRKLAMVDESFVTGQAGLGGRAGRVVCAAPDVAIALGYGIAAVLEERGDR